MLRKNKISQLFVFMASYRFTIASVLLLSIISFSSDAMPLEKDTLPQEVVGEALKDATSYVSHKVLSSMMSEASENCPVGYGVKGAIAMHGLPDIDKTNKELCRLFLYKKNLKNKHSLTVAEKGQLSGLNYLVPKGEVSYSVRPWVMDSLMFRSPFEPFTMYPLIAEIAEIPQDRSYVVFKINDNARFNDGSPITAKDVIFSFQKLKEKGLYNYQIAYKSIHATKIDERKVRFDFSIQNPEQSLLLGLMPVFSSDTSDKEFETQDFTPPKMSGAYVMDSAEVGKSIRLKKNNNYWASHTPQAMARFHYDTVKFDFFRNDMAAFESLRAGQSDFFYEDNLKRLFTAYNFPAIKKGDYVFHKVATGRPTGLYAFTMNARNEFLKDINLRKAMVLTFNYDAVNRYYLFNNFQQVDSIFGNSELSYSAQGFKRDGIPENYRHRLSMAHKILKNNGYHFRRGILYTPENHQVQLKLLLNNPVDEKFAGALKRDLEKIGIVLALQTVDDTIYQNHLSRFDYDMIVYQWYNSLSPGIEQKNYWHCDTAHKQGTRNYAGVCNKEIDQSINKLLDAKSRTELIQAAAQLDYYLMNQHYFIPLYGQSHYNIITKKNIIPSVGGATYFAIRE